MIHQRYLLFFAALILLCGCSQTRPESILKVSLAPLHSPYSTISHGDYHHTQLIDNDGNLYINAWKVNDDQITAFEQTKLNCTPKKEKTLFVPDAPLLDDLSDTRLAPSNYKPFVSCIHQAGFGFVMAEGYYPENYLLKLSKTHDRDDHYLPVGETVPLNIANKPYKQVLQKVKQCNLNVGKQLGNPAREIQQSDIVTVNTEEYVNALTSCISAATLSLVPSPTYSLISSRQAVRQSIDATGKEAPFEPNCYEASICDQKDREPPRINF